MGEASMRKWVRRASAHLAEVGAQVVPRELLRLARSWRLNHREERIAARARRWAYSIGAGPLKRHYFNAH